MNRPTREQVAVFPSQAAFRSWLESNHDSTPELWVGYYRKASGKTAMTYPEAVEEALCYGWIDGLTYRVDDEVHTNRFTPRRKGSNWSGPNIAKVAELKKAGRMHPAGLRAFEERDRRKDQPYVRDNPLRQALPSELERQIEARPAAWTYWQAQTPSYRRQAAFWIQSAVRSETRERRLASLIEDSAAGRPVKPLSYGGERR
jgi:uncharacterized protein YdeI (YjbR/CyaY-like superfamily)